MSDWLGTDGMTRWRHDGDSLVCEEPGQVVASIPADAALRLLAAEASDRLGWKWAYEHGPAWAGGYPVPGASFAVEDLGLGWRLYVFRDIDTGTDRPGIRFSLDSTVHGMLTPDELLACLHGKFLLEAAIQKANGVNPEAA